MLTEQSVSEHPELEDLDEDFDSCSEVNLELDKLYAPRRPMHQLPDEFRVTDSNTKPPLVHFGIPVDLPLIYEYADVYGLTEYWPQFPNLVSPVTPLLALENISKHVQFTLGFGWPFGATADCDILLVLYDNYTMDDEMLIDDDQEDVIRMVQEVLGLDKSVRPKWYFDIHDKWRPGA